MMDFDELDDDELDQQIQNGKCYRVTLVYEGDVALRFGLEAEEVDDFSQEVLDMWMYLSQPFAQYTMEAQMEALRSHLTANARKILHRRTSRSADALNCALRGKPGELMILLMVGTDNVNNVYNSHAIN